MTKGTRMLPRRLIIVVHDLSNNAVGRAHVLWSLAREAGIPATIHGTSRGELWAPLRGSRFGEDVNTYSSRRQLLKGLIHQASQEDLLVPLKTWPGSLGVALRCAERCRAPLLADVDDPDHAALAGQWASSSYRQAFRARMRLRGQSPREFDQLEEVVRSLPRMVSNPTLQCLYGGGWLVPHVRSVPEQRPPLTSEESTTIAFVGTPRSHKGLPSVRQAVASKQEQGFRLVVTADAPRDARPWEDWVGVTTLEAGRVLVQRADVVIIAQKLERYGYAQLPARLVDAMSLGRPVIATSTPPIEWAMGGESLTVTDTSPQALEEALECLRDPTRRTAIATALHERARRLFSFEAVIPTFLDAIHGALDAGDG